MIWNEKHDLYGWNLNRHPDIDNPNPCEGCIHCIKDFPYCELPAIKSTTCNCDGKLKYYEKNENISK